MISAMLAYVLNRFQFRGNHLIRNLFMVAALIPGIATQVTVYQIMTVLHLVNTLYGYIFLMLGTDVIAIYIFLQFSRISRKLWMRRRFWTDAAISVYSSASCCLC